MLEPLRTEEYRDGRFRIEIFFDETPENPRNWCNVGKMVCFHRRYNIGDDHDLNESDFDGWDEVEQYLIEAEDAWVILPLFMYDHGGITIRTGPFSCSWDSGQVGFIYATKEAAVKAFGEDVTEERVREHLEQEVEIYDMYVRGETYGYVVIDTYTEKEVDSCWGFIGEEWMLAEAKRAADYYAEHIRPSLFDKVS